MAGDPNGSPTPSAYSAGQNLAKGLFLDPSRGFSRLLQVPSRERNLVLSSQVGSTGLHMSPTSILKKKKSKYAYIVA